MAERRLEHRLRGKRAPAAAHPCWLDEETAALAGEIATALTLRESAPDDIAATYTQEEDRVGTRLRILNILRGTSDDPRRDKYARAAWGKLQRLLGDGQRFERVGREVARFCADHWPRPKTPARRGGRRPAETIGKIKKEVQNLQEALGKSPALEELCALDLLPDSLIEMLGDSAPARGPITRRRPKRPPRAEDVALSARMLAVSSPVPSGTRQRSAQAVAAAITELRGRVLTILLETSAVDLLAELVEAAQSRLTADGTGRLQHGDAVLPANEFALELVDVLRDELVGPQRRDEQPDPYLRRRLKLPLTALAKIAAGLTHAAYFPRGPSADALRDALKRRGKTVPL